jgi:hypothetical protein
MTASRRIKRPTGNWYFVIPEVAAPIGGALFKEIGHMSTWAAIGVGVAPYMITVIRYMLFLIVCVPAEICYLCSSQARQDAIRQLIILSANALVSMQILTPVNSGISHSRQFPASKPELRVLEGGPDTPSQQGN